VIGTFKVGDERVGFITSEGAVALTLREPKWATRITKPVVPGSLEQLEEAVELAA
jgi:hypothetical protein